jgi:hypothetical protein
MKNPAKTLLIFDLKSPAFFDPCPACFGFFLLAIDQAMYSRKFELNVDEIVNSRKNLRCYKTTKNTKMKRIYFFSLLRGLRGENQAFY